jgi:hypothetical protein
MLFLIVSGFFRILKDYKNSIKWTFVIGLCIMFNVVLIFENWTWGRFFGLNGVFFIMTILVYVQSFLDPEVYKKINKRN